MSPDFRPGNNKELALQFHIVLAHAMAQSQEQSLNLLYAAVPLWDRLFPNWRDDLAAAAAIELARGNRQVAIDMMIENLENRIGVDLANECPYLLYRHVYYYKELANDPAVAKLL